MSIRYLIAGALMAGTCAAHADVLPSSPPIGSGSLIGSVNRAAGSDAVVQALYNKVSASVGSDMKVSLKQGIDGVYVTGLSTAKAAALAGDGMSVINTADGFKIVQAATGNQTSGGGATTGGIPATGTPSGSAPTTGGANNPGVGNGTGGGAVNNPGIGNGTGGGADNNPGIGAGIGAGKTDAPGIGKGDSAGNGPGVGVGVGVGIGIGKGDLGNQADDVAAVPEPSTVALMLAGLLGVAGLGRRRAR
jgi:hypothetical protein